MTTATPEAVGPMLTVTDAATARQLTTLAEHLPPAPARVLDAGCGRGDLALALMRSGYAVTAVDVDADAVARAVERGVPAIHLDIATFTADPFDAIVFSLSLHHITQLQAAIRQARRLLRPGATLVVDEFAWERADAPTATWFYDAAALLASSGRFNAPELGGLVMDPLRQWVTRHRDEDPLHPGRRIINAVGEVFKDNRTIAGPYLARYLAGWLPDDSAGARILATLEQIERQRIQDRAIAPTGFRLVAKAR